MKRKFKQRWSSISPNEQSPLILTELTEHKMTTRCDVANKDPSLWQAQQCGEVNSENGVPTLPSCWLDPNTPVLLIGSQHSRLVNGSQHSRLVDWIPTLPSCWLDHNTPVLLTGSRHSCLVDWISTLPSCWLDPNTPVLLTESQHSCLVD